MFRHTPLYSWIGRVVAAFPHLSRPQATVLALYSFGAILARKCGLTSVTVHLAKLMGVSYDTVRSRLQEFYQPASVKSGTQRRELDVAVCFAPLLAWVLKGWPSNRLALALGNCINTDNKVSVAAGSNSGADLEFQFHDLARPV